MSCLTCVWGRVARMQNQYDPRPTLIVCSRIICPMTNDKVKAEQKRKR